MSQGDAASCSGRGGADTAVSWWNESGSSTDRWRGWRWMWRLRISRLRDGRRRGRVIEVLGPPDAFGVDVEIIIRKHHLPHVFPANVLAEAAARLLRRLCDVAGRCGAGRRRRDFRGLQIVTIDGETARDFDDAVLVRPLDEWQLGVAGSYCRREPLCAAGDCA